MGKLWRSILKLEPSSLQTIQWLLLYERLPDAQPWVVRIGYRAVHRFGARSLKDAL
jgi:hypothetical protein